MISIAGFVQLFVLVLIGLVGLNESLNSYIYLPDKYIQEEISIGSLIVDLSDELDKQHPSTSAFDKQQQSRTTTTAQSDLNESDSAENQHFTFLEDAKSSTENTYYLIDSITGRITSKRYLDRESMCMNKHCMDACDSMQNINQNCKMNLKVLLIPSYDIVSLNIIVQDLNDNKPQFRVDYINQSIPENVPFGYKIPIDLAYDPDAGLNSIQSYTLNSNGLPLLTQETFKLVQNNNTNELALVVKQKLDREKEPQYNLSILACDGGSPSNCGQLKIVLNILDINDHNPVFFKESYAFTVPENVFAGTVIGQVTAYDLDEGINAQIKYKLIGLNTHSQTGADENTNKNSLSYFSLNPDTGSLSVNKKILDFELEQHFSLTVEARDSGVGSFPAYATVEIFVQDENDNQPEISVSFFNTLQRNSTTDRDSTTQVIYLKENYEPNKFIGLVSLIDRDSGENSRLDWKVLVNEKEIKSNEKDQLLAIHVLNANSFTINTGADSHKLFDREKINNLNVNIISWDFGEKPNYATYNFVIVLIDENDNAPLFDKPEYELKINENNELERFIYKFNATDLDQNENGQVVYLLEFIDDEKFVSIEETTGILRAAKEFDRELKDTYMFYVIARDSSDDLNKRLWSKVKCTLKILDLNDNKPNIFYNTTTILPYREFSNKTTLILKVDENVPIHTQLIKFTCNDSDLNAETRLSLRSRSQRNTDLIKESSSLDQLPFRINPENGQFSVVKKLDREIVDYYEMQIVCTDQSNGVTQLEKLNSTLNLIVRLNDVNDNCPRSLNNSSHLSDDYFDMSVAASSQARTKFINRSISVNDSNKTIDLFKFNYTDSDVGKNGELKFQLHTHLDLFKLKIEEKNSIYTLRVQLKNQSGLNEMKLGKYVIKVKISDQGYPTCIKTDSYILYVGNEKEAKTQSILIEMLKSMYSGKRLDADALNADFINDKEEHNEEKDINESEELIGSKSEDVSEETIRLLAIRQQHSLNTSNNSNRSYLISMFRSSQFVIIFILIGALLLIAAMLSSIGLINCCRKRATYKKGMDADKLKVKNYRGEHDLNNNTNRNSSSSTTPSTEEENVISSQDDDDDDNKNEINNLLEPQEKLISNRYSLIGNKSIGTSANSVSTSSAQLSHSIDMNNSNIRSHYSNQLYVNSKRNSTFITNPHQQQQQQNHHQNVSYKPIYEQQNQLQNIKTSSSFLSSSSSSSITPPYSSYKQVNNSIIDNVEPKKTNNNVRKFLDNDNGTLPNYVRLNRNYQQNQRNLAEPENTRTFMKSFPYNQLNPNLKKDGPQRILINSKLLSPNLNDSTSSSTSSSSQMVTPSTSTDCSSEYPHIIVPTTTTSTVNSTSPSAASSASSSHNSSDNDIKYKQYGEFLNSQRNANLSVNDNETSCLYPSQNEDLNATINRTNRIHYLRSSAV